MAYLQSIPDGLIIDILICGVLDDVDVLRFGETCRRFYFLSSSSSIWKAMCCQKFPFVSYKLGKSYKQFQVQDFSKNDRPKWKVLYYQTKLIFDNLKKIFQDNYCEDQLDDKIFQKFLTLSEKFSFDFVSAVLYDLITSASIKNLTVKYYAQKAYYFICHNRLKPQIMRLLDEESSAGAGDLSKLMQGVLLIERWFNPLEQYPSCNINEFIAKAVQITSVYFEKLFVNQPSQDPAKIEHLKFLAVNHTFFEELKFCGNQGDYFNVNNSFIHHVIETRRGIPILLSIIYREIAMRIGLNLECVNHPGHFVLRWQVEDLVSPQPTISEIAK